MRQENLVLKILFQSHLEHRHSHVLLIKKVLSTLGSGQMESLMEKDSCSIQMELTIPDTLIKEMRMGKEDLLVQKDGYMKENCKTNKPKGKEYSIIKD